MCIDKCLPVIIHCLQLIQFNSRPCIIWFLSWILETADIFVFGLANCADAYLHRIWCVRRNCGCWFSPALCVYHWDAAWPELVQHFLCLEKLVCSHPVRNWGSVQRLKCQLHRRADTRTNWRVAIRVEHFDAVWPTSITGNPCYFPNLTCILPICTFLKCKMHIWKHWCIVPYLWKRYSISSIFTPVVLNPCHWIFKKLSYYLRGAAQDKLSSD